MNYVGIDWAYGRAAWCEGSIPADEGGLARSIIEAKSALFTDGVWRLFGVREAAAATATFHSHSSC